jgi:hypothetical protein
MADFVQNIQTARNVLLPMLQGSDALQLPDRDQLDYAWLKRSAPVWLTLRTVANYDPNDFCSFSEGDRDRLTAAVRDFRAIAEAVAGRDPTPQELKSGLAILMILFDLLNLSLDAEGKALLLALYRTRAAFPGFVLGIDYTLGTDATGDPGIWIWVIVPDELDPDLPEFKQFVTKFPPIVRDALARIKSDRLPYIHYRLLSEALGLVAEDAA